jgi:glycerol kinase
MNLETLHGTAAPADLFGVPARMPAGDPSDRRRFADARGIRVTASLVGSAAALFGHGCRRKGDAKITFGTGAFALAVAGQAVPRDTESGLEATVAWKLGDAPLRLLPAGRHLQRRLRVNWARSLGPVRRLRGDRRLHGRERDRARPRASCRRCSGLSCPYWGPPRCGPMARHGLGKPPGPT